MALIDFVSKGYYEVYVNDIKVSKHSKKDKANARSFIEKIKDETAKIEVRPPVIVPKIDKMALMQFIQSTTVNQNNTVVEFAPVLHNFRVEPSTPDRLYFDSSENIIVASTVTGFYIGDGNGITITGVTSKINQKTGHYLTLSSSVDYWKELTIRYEGGSDFVGSGTLILHPFTLEYVTNNNIEPIATANRYVTATATGGGNGLTEATAWTPNEANDNAIAGNTVWIKAGLYATFNWVIDDSGTSTSPIKFIGYKNTIGDVITNYYDYNNAIDNNEMPTFDGGSQSTGGYGMKMWSSSGGQFLIFKNLQFTNYQNGFHLTKGENVVFERINITEIGNATSYSVGITTWARSYQTPYTDNRGQAVIRANPSNIKILDCVVKNTTGNAIVVSASTLVKGSQVYCNRGATLAEANDYYIIGSGDNLIFINNKIERADAIAHAGHGMGTRSDNKTDFNKPGTENLLSEYTLVADCTMIGLGRPIEIRNYGANYGVYKRCTINGYGAIKDNKNGGISLFGGCKFNIIEQNTISDVSEFIEFYNNTESEVGAKNIENNIIRNCLFVNGYLGMKINNVDASNSLIIENNNIYNNTFYNILGAFMRDYSVVNIINYLNNLSKNNIYSKIYDNGFIGDSFTNVLSDVTFNNAFNSDTDNFFDIENANHATWATNYLEVDPQFINNIDFIPQNTLLKSGVPLTNYDINKLERDKIKSTIGAIEI